MVTVLAPTSSHAVVTLESVLDARRAIVQHDSKRTETIALSEQNSARISGLNDKIFEIEKSLQEIKQDIEKNEKGMSEFPEMVGNFQPKITALITSKAKLLNQRKKNQSNIKRLKVENNELTTKAKEHKINSDKQKKRLGNLKQSYLDRQVSNTIKQAEQGQTIIETQQLTCSFTDVFGQYKGDKSACSRLAVEQAKRNAAEKYSPTNITSEIESRNFEITSESSSQYYSVDVLIIKEFKDDTWLKMEVDAERFRAQFKGEIKITPAFTLKTRQKLMNRFAVQLAGEIGQVAAMEKRNTISSAQDRIEREEEANIQERKASQEYLDLRREIDALKNANNAQQVEVQLQASVQAEHQRNLDEQTEESRIKAEVQRRLKAERQLLEKEAKAIEEKDERDVFLPPVF
jgi:hypothetical protein